MSNIEDKNDLAQTSLNIYQKQISELEEELLKGNELYEGIEDLKIQMEIKKDPSVLLVPKLIESSIKGLSSLAAMEVQLIIASLATNNDSLLGTLVCFGYSLGLGLTNYMYEYKNIKEQIKNINLALLDYNIKQKEDELKNLSLQIIARSKNIDKKVNSIFNELANLENEEITYSDSDISKDNVKIINKN